MFIMGFTPYLFHHWLLVMKNSVYNGFHTLHISSLATGDENNLLYGSYNKYNIFILADSWTSSVIQSRLPPSLSSSLLSPPPSLSSSLLSPLPLLFPSPSPLPFSLPLPPSPLPFSLPLLPSPLLFSLPLPPYRFDTGFLILSLMMDKKEQFASWLPVEQLWPLLIGVACQHTGQERLKVIGLLMELINFQSSKEGEGDGWKKKMQLSALKPLWQLYTTIIKDYGK